MLKVRGISTELLSRRPDVGPLEQEDLSFEYKLDHYDEMDSLSYN